MGGRGRVPALDDWRAPWAATTADPGTRVRLAGIQGLRCSREVVPCASSRRTYSWQRAGSAAHGPPKAEEGEEVTRAMTRSLLLMYEMCRSDSMHRFIQLHTFVLSVTCCRRL